MPKEIELLSSADDVTLAWLDRALAAAGISGTETLADFRAQPVGTGKVGEIVRFDLEWRSGARGPASVIGKFASRDPASRRAGLMTGTYVREVSFYRRLAGGVKLRIPTCHGVAFDESSGAFVLLLEDLRAAEAGDQMRGCSVDAAADAIESLALLHAPYHASDGLRAEAWLPVRGEAAAPGLAALYDSLVGGFVDGFAGRLDASVIDVAMRFRGRVGAWIRRDRPPLTLVHGDYRVENMLFGGPDADFSLAVVDWQTVGVGPGLCDLAYFLGAGLPVELRRKHEVSLVDVYCAAMRAEGIDLDRARSFEAYRLHAFAGLHMAVVASQLVGRDPRSDEMFCTMAERHAAQITDLESFALLDA